MGEQARTAKSGTSGNLAAFLDQETTIMTVIRLIMGASLVLYALSSAA